MNQAEPGTAVVEVNLGVILTWANAVFGPQAGRESTGRTWRYLLLTAPGDLNARTHEQIFTVPEVCADTGAKRAVVPRGDRL